MSRSVKKLPLVTGKSKNLRIFKISTPVNMKIIKIQRMLG